MLKSKIFIFILMFNSLLHADFALITKNNKQSLSPCLLGEMQEANTWMNGSDFYTNSLKVIDCTDSYFNCMDQHTEIVSYRHTFKGIEHGHFFNRNSGVLVIVIPPFNGRCKDIVRFAAIYKEYDILLLSGSTGTTIKQALEWARNSNYRAVIGSGICYGAIKSLLVQQEYEMCGKDGFDLLIVDSCPSSVRDVFFNACKNPVGVASFGAYDTPAIMKKITNLSFVEKIFNLLANPFSYITPLADLVKDITIPCMFIVGKDDYLVTEKQFYSYFEKVQNPLSCALVTPFKHIRHSLKAKEIYRSVVTHFIKTVLEKGEELCVKTMNVVK